MFWYSCSQRDYKLHNIFHDCRNVLPNTGYKFAWQIPMFCQIVMWSHHINYELEFIRYQFQSRLETRFLVPSNNIFPFLLGSLLSYNQAKGKKNATSVIWGLDISLNNTWYHHHHSIKYCYNDTSAYNVNSRFLFLIFILLTFLPFFLRKKVRYSFVNNSVCMSHARGSAEHKKTYQVSSKPE